MLESNTMQPLLAVLTHNVVSLYAQPDRGSERVSQALLGDVVEMLEGTDAWVRVKTRDDYSGWVMCKHLRPVAPDEPYASPGWPYDDPKAARVRSLTVAVNLRSPFNGPTVTRLAFGTIVRIRGEWPGTRGVTKLWIPRGTEQNDGVRTVITYPDSVRPVSDDETTFDPGYAASVAQWFIGTPYLWGGSTPFGFDCSGFVQAIYREQNVILPRDAYLQADCALGTRLPPDARLKPGDLVFFGGTPSARGRTITHVGMALGKKRIIHASGRDGVCINTTDEMAADHGYRTVSVWRYGPAEAPSKRKADR
jgi:hypothetical protein